MEASACPGAARRAAQGAARTTLVLGLVALVLALALATPARAQGPPDQAVVPQTTAAGSGLGEAVAFYVLAAAAAGSAIGCVIASNIVRMAMCLLGTLGAVALLYFLMAANFLGAIQLIVYAGGTLIVIVFGVMLTSRAYGVRLRPRRIELVAGALVCLGLFVGLLTILVLRTPSGSPSAPSGWSRTGETPVPQEYTVAKLGDALLSTYLVPFELASVLLLAVMIGAAYLAQPPGCRVGTAHRISDEGAASDERPAASDTLPTRDHA